MSARTRSQGSGSGSQPAQLAPDEPLCRQQRRQQQQQASHCYARSLSTEGATAVLSQDLLQAILAKAVAQHPSLLHTAPLVCRAWCAALQSPQTLHTCPLKDQHPADAARALASWLRRTGHGHTLQELSLRLPLNCAPGAAGSARILQALLGTAPVPSLRQLRFTGAWMLHVRSAQVLTRHLPQLLTLNLPMQSLNAKGAAVLAAGLTRLTCLSAERCSSFGRTGAAALAPLTQLRSLDVGGSTDNEGIAALAPSMVSLTHLRISGLSVAGFRALAEMTSLVSLEGRFNSPGAEGIRAIAGALTGLTGLNLSMCSLDGDGAAALAPLTQLRDLRVSYNGFGDAGACVVARSLCNLTRLEVSCNHISNPGVLALSQLRRLQALDISGSAICSGTVRSLASALTNLASLRAVSCCLGADGIEAVALLTALTHLDVSLNLFGCAGHGRGVLGVVARLTGLRDLRLGGTGVQPADCQPLSALTNLSNLALSSVSPHVRSDYQRVLPHLPLSICW